MKKLIFISLGILFVGFVSAQSAASSREVGVDTTNATQIALEEARQQEAKEMEEARVYEESNHRSTIVVPDEIWMLLDQGKIKEAEAKFGSFRNSLKKEDPMQVLLLNEEFYSRALSNIEMLNAMPGGTKIDASTEARMKAQRREVIDLLRQSYEDDVRVMRYELDDVERDDYESIIKIATKIIEKDPEFLPAYQSRGEAYLQKGMTKEFCEDFGKLPARVASMTPSYGTLCK